MFLLVYTVICFFSAVIRANVISNISTETFINCQAHGFWEDRTFSSTTLKEYNRTNFIGNSRPNILMLGDSISRNAVNSYCRTVKLNAYTYTDCNSAGGHYACVSNEVAIASFFIFGSTLSEPNQNNAPGHHHFCPNTPYGTLNRLHNNLPLSVQNVFADKTIDIIVINAMRWTIIGVADRESTFETFRFMEFAQEYIYNMTAIINEVRSLFPTSTIMLQKLPYIKKHEKCMIKMNKLLDIIALQQSIYVFDVENMCAGYDGKVIERDEVHPTSAVSVAFVKLLIDIANIQKVV